MKTAKEILWERHPIRHDFDRKQDTWLESDIYEAMEEYASQSEVTEVEFMDWVVKHYTLSTPNIGLKVKWIKKEDYNKAIINKSWDSLQLYNLYLSSKETERKDEKSLTTNQGNEAQSCLLVSSQFCPRCSPGTYGNSMVQIVLGDEKCGSCGYMIHHQIIATGKEVKDNWISIEDRLPAYEEVVLGFGNDEGIKVKDFCSVDENGFRMQAEINKKVKITHWQPLPEPPKS
jgi:DNA-directed RNA polymerase subunit L